MSRLQVVFAVQLLWQVSDHRMGRDFSWSSLLCLTIDTTISSLSQGQPELSHGSHPVLADTGVACHCPLSYHGILIMQGTLYNGSWISSQRPNPQPPLVPVQSAHPASFASAPFLGSSYSSSVLSWSPFETFWPHTFLYPCSSQSGMYGTLGK